MLFCGMWFAKILAKGAFTFRCQRGEICKYGAYVPAPNKLVQLLLLHGLSSLSAPENGCSKFVGCEEKGTRTQPAGAFRHDKDEPVASGWTVAFWEIDFHPDRSSQSGCIAQSPDLLVQLEIEVHYGTHL